MSKREASRATLERLAEAVKLAQNAGWTLPDVVEEPIAAYRAEIAPGLRTREQVDADIAAVVREHGPVPSTQHGAVWEIRGAFPERLMMLCREPTQDSGPSSADAPPSASPAGADLSDRHVFKTRHGDEIDLGAEDACSCEESERLKDELKEARQLLDFARRSAQDIVTILEEGRARSVDVGALEERVCKLEGNMGFRP